MFCPLSEEFVKYARVSIPVLFCVLLGILVCAVTNSSYVWSSSSTGSMCSSTLLLVWTACRERERDRLSSCRKHWHKKKSLISQSVSLYEQQHFENDDLSNNSEQQSQVWMADIYTTQFSEWSFCWHCMDVSKQALESLAYNFSLECLTKRSEVLNLCILL